ncbi:MAG TPA: OmpA family protein, partial [Myxococcales bacterium]|nr:OmpA family protein [Myxococcales bacterium]
MIATALLSVALMAQAQAPNPWDMAKKVAGDAATKGIEGEVNKRLLAEGQKNQCSFKTDSD